MFLLYSAAENSAALRLNMPTGSRYFSVHRGSQPLSDMFSDDSLQVAEEEVVESSSNKLSDIYSFVAKGSFPLTMNPLQKKTLRRYARKFIINGKLSSRTLMNSRKNLCFSHNPFPIYAIFLNVFRICNLLFARDNVLV